MLTQWWESNTVHHTIVPSLWPGYCRCPTIERRWFLIANSRHFSPTQLPIYVRLSDLYMWCLSIRPELIKDSTRFDWRHNVPIFQPENQTEKPLSYLPSAALCAGLRRDNISIGLWLSMRSAPNGSPHMTHYYAVWRIRGSKDSSCQRGKTRALEIFQTPSREVSPMDHCPLTE